MLNHDLNAAWRGLGRKPLFAATAILTLALGVGGATAVFSVVHAVLLRPLPYADPGRLVATGTNSSVPDVDDITAQTQLLQSAGGVTRMYLDDVSGDEPRRYAAGLLTAGLFDTLGVPALLGDVLQPEQDAFGAEPAVVLSHHLWQERFGGDKSVIGEHLALSGVSYRVVGVMPASFRLPRLEADIWTSVRVTYPVAAAERGVHFLRTYARLAPGVTLAQAQAEMDLISNRLAALHPEENRGVRYVLLPLLDRLVGDVRPALLILFAAVGLVLLIACANYASLLLVRASGRATEFALRASLGASRWHLVRQLLVESFILSIGGGVIGGGLAFGGVSVLRNLLPAGMPRAENIEVNAPVLMFALGLSLITGLAFGVAPVSSAIRLRLTSVLAEGSQRAGGSLRRLRLRRVLVVAEVGVSTILLTGAILLMQTLVQLQAVNPGFEPENVVSVRLELPEARYAEIRPQSLFRDRLIESLQQQPGTKAALISELPLTDDWLDHEFIIEGRPRLEAGAEPSLFSRAVAGDYFALMGIPVQRGRLFDSADREGAPLVGVVNEAMVRRYFPDEDPIGARVRWARMEAEHSIEIVGVVGNIKHFSLAEDDEPAIYTPYAQLLQNWKRWQQVVVSGPGEPAALMASVKRSVRAIDPLLPVERFQTLAEVLDTSIAQERSQALLVGLFAGIALLLAAIGVYGLIAYITSQRLHEVGIRFALGARRIDVLSMVLWQGLRLASVGVAIGLVGALGLMRYLSSLLFGVSATEPSTYALVASVLSAVTVLACYLPARRASRTNISQALRYE
jgi:putative ABC transport system permease protein